MGAFPSNQLGTAAVLLTVAVAANYQFVHARWLSVLTTLGLLGLAWRIAWEADGSLRRLGARTALCRGLTVMALVWTIVWVAPLLVHYPPLILRVDALVGLVAFAYLMVAFTVPARLVSWTGRWERQ